MSHKTISDNVGVCPHCSHVAKVVKNSVQVTGCSYNFYVCCSDYCKEDKMHMSYGATKEAALIDWNDYCYEYEDYLEEIIKQK